MTEEGLEDTMKKGELLKLLQEDTQPMDAEIEIYMECTNNDEGFWGAVTGLKYDKHTKSLHLTGEYEEE